MFVPIHPISAVEDGRSKLTLNIDIGGISELRKPIVQIWLEIFAFSCDNLTTGKNLSKFELPK